MTDGSWTPSPPSGDDAPAAASPPPRPRSRVWPILATVLLLLSVIANGVLLLIVIGMGMMLATTMATQFSGAAADDALLEQTVERGPSGTKIAVVRIQGLIEDTLVERVRRGLDRARRDDGVVAVILRINSPGGYLTASDALYHHVAVFAEETGKPVVAAMDSVAASGGYYAACAADTIVAQRTTVTGSIGIIAQYFFLNELMEDKLGIQSVTLKRGQQKDWPNMFSGQMTPEQRDYIMEALLDPGTTSSWTWWPTAGAWTATTCSRWPRGASSWGRTRGSGAWWTRSGTSAGPSPSPARRPASTRPVSSSTSARFRWPA